MKRQSILTILLLLQVLFICNGCGGSQQSTGSPAALEETVVTEEAAIEEASIEEAAAPAEAEAFLIEEVQEAAYDGDTLEKEIIADQKASNAENVEDAVGIFEGLEDNHTAIFSFDGAETAFYFEEPTVQNVLFEAVLGSTYTLSYHYDDSFGYVIYEISE